MAHVEPGDAHDEMRQQSTLRNPAADMVDKCKRAARWLREEASHRVAGHPATTQIDALAFAVEWLIEDHAAISAGCDQLHATVQDQARELQARREILDAIAGNVGDGNCWLAGAEIDWRQRLRDFANDREQHRIGHAAWEGNRTHGVTLYWGGGFFTAYYEDAAELWGRADDTLPMFHVGVQSDPPHRTVIHPLHIAAWLAHLAETCLPVDVRGVDADDFETDPDDDTTRREPPF